MTDINLGRLERQQLRDVWQSESSGFTPWLARQENIALLADTLGIVLEVEKREKFVGPFRADLLCRDVTRDPPGWVLIENQLERSDHSHLGQLLTYASGLQARTIVWIASSFTEEHRSTLDWLNEITNASCAFFGLEVELWRIGASAPAPKFNIISKPNDWSQSVSRAAQAVETAEESDLRRIQKEYWAALNIVLDAAGGPVAGNKKPQPQQSMAYPIGRSNFYLRAVMVRAKKLIRAELYLTGSTARAALEMLREDRADIEQSFGAQLDWHLAEQDCRLSIALDDVDPLEKDAWAPQHAWLAKHLNELHRVLGERVRKLDLRSSEL